MGRRLAVVGAMVAALVLGRGGPPVGAAPSDRCYVGGTYLTFLSRPATPAELDDWSGRIDAGTPSSAIPAALAASDEWLGVTVTDIYRAALDRDPDAAGLAFWTARLRAGAKVNRVGALVYGSPEFLARSGGGLPGFVDELYARILERAPVAADRAYWVIRAQRDGRGRVAEHFFGSAESRGRRVDALYQRILGRWVDEEGRAFWVRRLATVNDVRLAVELASSSEARGRFTLGCWQVIPITGPADHANQGTSVALDVSTDGGTVLLRSTTPLTQDDPDDDLPGLYLVDVATGVFTLLPVAAPAPPSATLTDDGTTVGYVAPDTGGGDATATLLDVATGATTPVAAAADLTGLTVSGDGGTVAFSSADDGLVPGDEDGRADVFVVEVDGGATTRLVGHAGGLAYDPTLSDDGRVVAFGSASPVYGLDVWQNEMRSADVFVHDRTTGVTTALTQKPQLPSAAQGFAVGAEVSGDGTTVVYTDSQAISWIPGGPPPTPNELVRRVLATGEETRPGPLGGDIRAGGPSVSDDGRSVAFTSRYQHDDIGGHSSLAVRNPRGGQRVVGPDTPGITVDEYGSPMLAGDGRSVVFTAVEGGRTSAYRAIYLG